MAADKTQQVPEPLEVAAREVARCFEKHGVQYALIGGVATGIRSQIRATEDLDFIAAIPLIILPRVLDDLQSAGVEMDQPEVIRRWITEHMVVLTCHGVRVDWLKPVIAAYQHVIETASADATNNESLRVASAEGLIVTKLIAWRTQDQADIERLLSANRGQLDVEWIRREWEAIGDRFDPKMQRFDAMLAEFYST
jgi:hypothetical protein